MGVNQSTSNKNVGADKYGGIYIKADKDLYYPGDQFTGIIYLNIQTKYPGNTLSIEVKHCQKWYHAENLSKPAPDNNIQHSCKMVNDKKEIFHSIVPVYKSDTDGFLPGQYAFPISFIIPTEISASIYHETDSGAITSNFSVKAILGHSEPDTPKLIYKENIIIEEKPGDWIPQAEDSRTLSSCCCRNFGQASLSVTFEKQGLAPGQTANVKYTIDNSNSSVNFNTTKFTLSEEVLMGEYSSGGYNFSVANPLLVKEIEGVKQKTMVQEKEVQIIIPPCDASDLKTKKLPFKNVKGSQIVNLKLNKDEINPTVEGKYVRLRHHLSVELNSDAGCCLNFPRVKFPIRILYPQIALKSTVEPPYGWNPKFMPVNNLSLEAGRIEKLIVQQPVFIPASMH